jgi:hypothetical protein
LGAGFILPRVQLNLFMRFMLFERLTIPNASKDNYGDAGNVRTLKLVFAAGAVHDGVTLTEHKSAGTSKSDGSAIPTSGSAYKL